MALLSAESCDCRATKGDRVKCAQTGPLSDEQQQHSDQDANKLKHRSYHADANNSIGINISVFLIDPPSLNKWLSKLC